MTILGSEMMRSTANADARADSEVLLGLSSEFFSPDLLHDYVRFNRLLWRTILHVINLQLADASKGFADL